MTLAQLRRTLGLRQTDVAKRLGVVQSRISTIERTPLDKLEWGTVCSYLEALGARAQITAELEDGHPSLVQLH